MDSDRKNLFDKYLKFGGIESGPKMFSGGLDAETMADHTAAEIAVLKANHTVPLEREEDSTVDFEFCLKAFLCVFLKSLKLGCLADAIRSSSVFYGLDVHYKADIQKYVGVIKNFLNYLMYHNVCPEYEKQVEAARKLCEQGQDETWDIVQAQRLLPGSFNIACSELFGGMYQGRCDPACVQWMDEADKSWGLVGQSREEAGKIFIMGFAAHGSDEQMEKYEQAKRNKRSSDNDAYEAQEEDMDLQITDISLGRSDPGIVALYQSERAKGLPILGKLRARIWKSPLALMRDQTEEEEMLLSNESKPDEMEFWVDDLLLEKLHVGMYLEATVRKLNFGIVYFDAVQMLRPTYFTFLANEQMLEWRKVESEWLAPRETATEDGGAEYERKSG